MKMQHAATLQSLSAGIIPELTNTTTMIKTYHYPYVERVATLKITLPVHKYNDPVPFVLRLQKLFNYIPGKRQAIHMQHEYR